LSNLERLKDIFGTMMKHLVKKTLKTVYKIIPFKQPLFAVLKRVYQPSPKLYRHLHFTGTFTVTISKTEQFQIRHYGYEIENELFWRGILGGWEKVSIGLWIQLCRNAGVIVDIGANTGVYSLVAKAVNATSKVFAFEPVERVFYKLLENTRINEYDIVCIKKAVSNYSGTAVIYDTLEEHVYSVTVNKNIHGNSTAVKKFEVETITLKEFIANYKLSTIDLLKIDVETHEPEVLEGFGTYLNKYRPTMFVEVLNNEVGLKINELVKGLGYLFFNIDENKGVRLVNKIEQSDYYNYLLCNEQIAKQLKLIA
jgi:FkbM family methyltransferase